MRSANVELPLTKVKVYYNTRFWYGLWLINSEALFSRGLDCIWHGQTEAFYHTLLYVSDEKLGLMERNKPAKYYRPEAGNMGMINCGNMRFHGFKTMSVSANKQPFQIAERAVCRSLLTENAGGDHDDEKIQLQLDEDDGGSG